MTSTTVGVAATAGRGQRASSATSGEEEGQAAHRPHRYRPRGEGYPGHLSWPEPSTQGATRRTGHSIRWPCCSSCPSSPSRRCSSPSLIAPPFAGAGVGVKRIDARLTSLGAGFTRIPRFPERSTIYASRRQDGARHALPRQPRARGPERHEPDREQGRPRGRGRRASTNTAPSTGPRSSARWSRTSGDRPGGAGRIDDHAAAREERHHG